MKTIDLIRSRIEASEPQDTILTFLRTIEGKRINRTHVEKLRAQVGDADLRLRHQYGMTDLEWGGYTRSDGRQGGSLLLAHREKNVVVDVAYILEHNAAYYSAKDERNKTRQQALAQPEKCAALDQAIADYKAAQVRMVKLLGDDIFDPDRLDIEKKLIEGGE